MELSEETAESVLENITKWMELDPSDDAQYDESMTRLLALQMQFEDMLRATGRTDEPLTDLAERARTNNPYYRPVSILPNMGRSPNLSGK